MSEISVFNVVSTLIASVDKTLGDIEDSSLHNCRRVTDLQSKSNLRPADQTKINECCSKIGEACDLLKKMEILGEQALRIFESCNQIFNPSIVWVTDSANFKMNYLNGDSPWNFSLAYKANEMGEVVKLIESYFTDGKLVPALPTTRVGDYVCCYDKKNVFRGLVTKVLPDSRFKVWNIDSALTKIVKLENIYEMDRNFCQYPACAIQCSMLKEPTLDFRWSNELSTLFSSTLRECVLQVKLIRELNHSYGSEIPTFLVEVFGLSNSSESWFNLSQWINNGLIPNLKECETEGIASADLMDVLKETSLDPFHGAYESSETFPETEEETQALTSVPMASSQLTSSWSSALNNHPAYDSAGYTISENGKQVFHPYNIQVMEKVTTVQKCVKVNSASLTNMPTVHSSSVSNLIQSSTMNPEAPEYVFPSLAIKGGMTNKDCAPDRNWSSKTENSFKGFDNTGGITRSMEIVELNENLSNLEDDCLVNGGYQPTDESRICKFHAKGRCWKPACTKDHVTPIPGRWTMDKLPCYSDTHNKIMLPVIGDFVDLEVTYVTAPNRFYAHLPDKYSDTGDTVNGNMETLSSLQELLNNPATVRSLEFLQVDPLLGEYVLALSSVEKRWVRGKIVDNKPDNSFYEVFFVDYGVSEDINFKYLRKMQPRFTHLPDQAVECILSNIFIENPDPSHLAKGRKHLSYLIEGKHVSGHVVFRNLAESTLDVVVWCDRVDINSKMVELGFCSRISILNK